LANITFIKYFPPAPFPLARENAFPNEVRFSAESLSAYQSRENIPATIGIRWAEKFPLSPNDDSVALGYADFDDSE
jgi:hypothetical protein